MRFYKVKRNSQTKAMKITPDWKLALTNVFLKIMINVSDITRCIRNIGTEHKMNTWVDFKYRMCRIIN